MYTKYYKTVKMFHIFFSNAQENCTSFILREQKSTPRPIWGGVGNTTLAD